ncbi:hypothetical protein NECAME_11727 [Necator americanus]|uniref:Hexosyltransferase n=1 Tax=Necator americanus TaxID=51031 RepID=W2T3A6_NECAM|nr:hypothetical protein NECAME_11727 [Necator americanus]ETN76373.1 hypothetical protein NECAME_11727 [Necator americanus]
MFDAHPFCAQWRRCRAADASRSPGETQGLQPVQYAIIPRQPQISHENLIIIVLSRINDYRSRMYWRQTYGGSENRSKFGFSIIFPVGVGKTASTQEQLNSEAEVYGDILQADFIDTYRNLSLKLEDVFITGVLNREERANLINIGHEKFFRKATNLSYFDDACNR